MARRLVPALGLVFVGASQGSFQVIKSSSVPEMDLLLVVLSVVTSLTFITFLLACGMREPWL